MLGKKIEFRHRMNTITGVVDLIYTDLQASGSKDYVPITMLLVTSETGAVWHIYPRDVVNIIKSDNDLTHIDCNNLGAKPAVKES